MVRAFPHSDILGKPPNCRMSDFEAAADQGLGIRPASLIERALASPNGSFGLVKGTLSPYDTCRRLHGLCSDRASVRPIHLDSVHLALLPHGCVDCALGWLPGRTEGTSITSHLRRLPR